MSTSAFSDIRKVKETRKHFEKISTDLDVALTKNAQASRSKPHECEETNSILTAMQSCFSHTSLDYVFQVRAVISWFVILKICLTLCLSFVFRLMWGGCINSINYRTYIFIIMLVLTVGIHLQ